MKIKINNIFPLEKLEYIDIHSHLNFKDYKEDLVNVINRMKKNKVGTICIGTDLAESRAARKLAEENENILYSVALHPHDNLSEFDDAYKNQEKYFSELKEIANSEKCVSIGECGLDYFYIKPSQTDYSQLPLSEGEQNSFQEIKEKQKEIFIRHIELAKELNLPLMLHIRPSEMNGNREDAYLDAIEILKEYALSPQPSFRWKEGEPLPMEGATSGASGVGFLIGKDFMQFNTDPNVYKYLKEIREDLKKNKTEAEKKLWEHLRANQLGFHFRQQHILNNFIVDFVCLEKRIIIEIDGKIHDYQKESDEERQKLLENFGFKILRFKNEEILNNINLVLEKIKLELKDTFNLKGNFHFFTSTKNVLENILENLPDFTISIPAVCTFTNEYNEVIKSIPENRIHIETDSPFVLPKNRRKEAKRNEPTFVIDVFEKVCEIRGVENKEEFKNTLKDNFKRMFLK